MYIEDGDRIAFIGDSITANGGFIGYLFDFFATRYPNKRIEGYNFGIPGGSVPWGLRQLDWDIAPKKPNKAFVMYGMNDIGRTLYGVGADREKQRGPIEDYKKNLGLLVQELQDCGVGDITILSPTLYDQYVRIETENLYGCDDGLAELGEFVKELSAENGFRFIDLHTPLVEMTQRLQAADPSASLVGADRVHPLPHTHLVIAYLILQRLGETEEVSRFTCHAKDGTIETKACACSAFKPDHSGGFQLTCQPHRLPFPVSEQYRAAGGVVSPVFNREIIGVTGLDEGNYRVLLDENELGCFSAADLADGVNIAESDCNPNQVRAQYIHAKNFDRIRLESCNRTTKFNRLLLLREGIDPEDADAANAYLNRLVEQEGEGSFVLVSKRQQKEYGDDLLLAKQMQESFAEIYHNNRPVRYPVKLIKM